MYSRTGVQPLVAARNNAAVAPDNATRASIACISKKRRTRPRRAKLGVGSLSFWHLEFGIRCRPDERLESLFEYEMRRQSAQRISSTFSSRTNLARSPHHQ